MSSCLWVPPSLHPGSSNTDTPPPPPLRRSHSLAATFSLSHACHGVCPLTRACSVPKTRRTDSNANPSALSRFKGIPSRADPSVPHYPCRICPTYVKSRNTQTNVRQWQRLVRPNRQDSQAPNATALIGEWKSVYSGSSEQGEKNRNDPMTVLDKRFARACDP